MADRKITDLTALAAGSQATGDLLTIVDVSEGAAADKNKKITVESLFKGIPSNVGIGTSAPSAPLAFGKTVYGEPTSEDFYRIKFKDFGGTNNDVGIGQPNEHSLAFNIEGGSTASCRWIAGVAGERMRLDGNGNLGIGTTAPNEKLVVSGNASVTGALQITSNTSAPSAGAFLFRPASNTLAFGTNSAERIRITSDGKLGLGTSSPSYNMCIEGSSPIFDLYNTDATSNDSHSVTLQAYSPDTTYWNKMMLNASSIDFQIYGVTRTRIDNTGNLLIRRTTNTDNGALCVDQDASGGNVGISTVTTSTATRYHNMFRNGNGQVGAISTNGSATTYATSSDYRLKENVVDLDGAITRVKQLAPKRFNFIADADTTVDGFLAHEAQTVVPEAVTGTHNEVDDENNPVYQGIDQSKLVPLLTAALQEAIAKIETLEAKVTALEAQ